MATPTKLNPIQIHLLQMFDRLKSENELQELKGFLANYYAQKVDRESEKIWEEKGMNEDTIEELLNMHLRTPRK
ncbi:MAG: hypothetical protein MUF58_17490 [Arcicella sp.]|jgi:hypothetical protein|nr:hypothetical protein [Arcicella sp.]